MNTGFSEPQRAVPSIKNKIKKGRNLNLNLLLNEEDEAKSLKSQERGI